MLLNYGWQAHLAGASTGHLIKHEFSLAGPDKGQDSVETQWQDDAQRRRSGREHVICANAMHGAAVPCRRRRLRRR